MPGKGSVSIRDFGKAFASSLFIQKQFKSSSCITELKGSLTVNNRQLSHSVLVTYFASNFDANLERTFICLKNCFEFYFVIRVKLNNFRWSCGMWNPIRGEPAQCARNGSCMSCRSDRKLAKEIQWSNLDSKQLKREQSKFSTATEVVCWHNSADKTVGRIAQAFECYWQVRNNQTNFSFDQPVQTFASFCELPVEQAESEPAGLCSPELQSNALEASAAMLANPSSWRHSAAMTIAY